MLILGMSYEHTIPVCRRDTEARDTELAVATTSLPLGITAITPKKPTRMMQHRKVHRRGKDQPTRTGNRAAFSTTSLNDD